LDRDVERAKHAHRRAGAQQRAIERGEPFALRRLREASQKRRVQSACDAARYARPAGLAAEPPASQPMVLPEPHFLRALRQQRREAREERLAEDHISFLPSLPEAAELAKQTWAAPSFGCRPATSSATSAAEEAADAISTVRSIGVGQGEANDIINIWKGPSAEKKTAMLLKRKTQSRVLERSMVFVPYNPQEDEYALLHCQSALPATAPGVRPLPARASTVAAGAATPWRDGPRPVTSPSPMGASLEGRHLEPIQRGSTSQGHRASCKL